MSSKRGRKRNDNLPPNRARDVQRAFRARRAAHLQALEQRVTELEEENGALRVALNLPPASRPSLGKGPTGKDRPRTLEGDSHSYPSSTRSPESDSADLDSPTSTRTNSLSPSALRPESRLAHTVDAWDQSLLMGEQVDDGHGGAPSYQSHPPVSPSIPQKMAHPYSFPEPIPSNSRQNVGSGMYIATQQSHYSSPYGSNGYIARDGRDDPQQYSYAQPQFHTHDSSMHSHSPTRSHNHLPLHHAREPMSAQSGMPYAQRRTNPESHAFRILQQQTHLPNHLPNNNGIRMPPSPVPSDSGPPTRRPIASYGGGDSRINSLS